jgi:hypothetical protein
MGGFMKIKYLCILIVFLIAISVSLQAEKDDVLSPYVKSLKERGRDPVPFILQKLETHDLILFDDGLHTAVEPFEFYRELVRNPDVQKKVNYIFLEAVSMNQQPALDAYFASEIENSELLYPAFQNDFSGTGWPYKTYFDLLRSVWDVNASLSPGDRFKVIAVNAPAFWKEISTSTDLDLFRLSLRSNEYTMYKIMMTHLNRFKSGRKGVFLTNTRHAYKGIKNREGRYYWNCGTFFHVFNPGKTCSVRIHNINLYFKGRKKIDSKTARTTEGLEDVVIQWVRMEEGLWDSAFEATGNRPLAFDLKDTPFGDAAYIGNHMLNAAPGQTMADAYDALVFLKPVDKMRRTAIVDFIYTVPYKQEMERRLKILYTREQMAKMLQDHRVKTVREYIDKVYISRPEQDQPLARQIGPINAWKKKEF